MRASSYVALLRGINVGGNNLIPMADLRACFVEKGFANVTTYIQSGNVIFTTTDHKRAALVARIESALGTRFAYRATVVVRSHDEMRAIVEHAPPGFGKRPELFRYDVLFLKDPLTAAAAIAAVPVKEGVDEVHAGKRVLYYSRLISKATQSRMAKIVSLPIYKSLTIRNWNTTTKLLQRMDAV